MRFANESHFPKQFSRIRSNGKEGHVISHDLPSRLKFACHWARRMEATTIQVEDLHAAFLEADASFNLNHTRQTMRHMVASGVLVPEIRKLRETMSAKEIADKLGMCLAMVYYYLKG